MNSEAILIVVLALLVVTLSILLYRRIHNERLRLLSLQESDLVGLTDILQSTDDEAEVKRVITEAIRLLTDSFACDRLLFYRRESNLLRLVENHGGETVTRISETIAMSSKLESVISEDSGVKPLSVFNEIFTAPTYNHLDAKKCRLLFPIYWRHELYGLFCVGNSKTRNEGGLSLLLTGLAQSLSRSYMGGTVEAKEEKSAVAAEDSSEGSGNVERALLHLVRHTELQTLVEQLVQTLRNQLGLKRVIYLYETGQSSQQLRIASDGLQRKLKLPSYEEFKSLSAQFTDRSWQDPLILETGELVRPQDQQSSERTHLHRWSNELTVAGFQYMVSFPLSSNKSGVLAWQGNQPPKKTASALSHLSKSGTMLVENAESFRRIEELSYTDNLTGLANRRYLMKRLNEEIDRAGRYRRSLGLIMFDIDELKGVNDRYGHLAGDYVINQMGAVLKKSIRAIDIIARYGGDEFCVVMPEADAPTCSRFMGRLVDKIAKATLRIDKESEPLISTISVGGALFPEHAEDSESLIYAADMALLRSKESGRNQALLYKRT